MARPGHHMHMFTCAIEMRFPVPCSASDVEELNLSIVNSQARCIAKGAIFLARGLLLLPI